MLFLIGAVAGVLSGVFGIGGGLVIVPGLMFIVGFTKDQAVGTSMAALVPPAGLLAAIAYYRAGHVNIRYAALISVTLLVFAYFGAQINLKALPPQTFRYVYAGFLLLVVARLLLVKR